jgi:hypothetical protein
LEFCAAPAPALKGLLVRRRFSVIVLLLTLACMAISPLAYAGGKPTEAYDPLSHSATTSGAIHLYVYRYLVLSSGFTFGMGSPVTGSGSLRENCEHKFGPPSGCTTTNVEWKLADPQYCHSGSTNNAFIYGRLYTRLTGATAWHERPHYHDVVVADC